MKLHLPVLLRKALLACFAFAFACSATSAAADLTLGGDDSLTIDYAAANSIPDLAGGTLQLSGDTILLLSNCGVGDGKTYTLLTGVGALLDAEGNAITLDSTNNAISNYFDITPPGVGFWKNASLQLTHDGSLQFVRYDSIAIPSYEKSVNVSAVDDFIPYSSTSTDVVFKVDSSNQEDKTLVIENLSSTLMTEYADSWFLTSVATDKLAALTFRNVSRQLFHVASEEKLEFSCLDSISFESIIGSGVYGAAIRGELGSTITFSNSGVVLFEDCNTTKGGAIFLAEGGGNVSLNNNGSVIFHSNWNGAYGYGGAIYVDQGGGTLSLNDNGSVDFRDNTTTNVGGAIFAYFESKVTLNNNGILSFSGNRSDSRGGAIAVWTRFTPFEICNNGSVVFSKNEANSSGAAIHLDGPMNLSNNGSVRFLENTSHTARGAVALKGSIYNDSSFLLHSNENVSFEGNVGYGYPYSTSGAAIKMESGKLFIQNNQSVFFQENYVVNESLLRFISVYVSDAEDDGGQAVVRFSAPESGKIEFRDSIRFDVDSNSASAFYLNALYTNEYNQQIAQTGDIIFTGAYVTEKVIKDILDKHQIQASADEIAGFIKKSKTSEVWGTMQLHDGRLIIRDGAIMESAGIVVHSSTSQKSTPTMLLHHGTLTSNGDNSHQSNVITISGDSALELAGQNEARYSAITMSAGSSLIVNVDNTHTTRAALTLSSSSLTISGALTLQLNAAAGLTDGQSFALITGAAKPTNWDSTNVTVTSGTDGWDVSYDDLVWDGNTLWLYYDSRPDLVTATWTNESRDGKWNTTSINWEQDEIDYEYKDGVAVVFGDEGTGPVTLVGNIAPGSVLVDSTQDYTWVADVTEGGKLTGSMNLTKLGSGKLNIKTSNDYTGGTEIKGGTVVAGTASALGTGAVLLNGGTLEIGAAGVANVISNVGSSTLQTSAGVTHDLTGIISNSGRLTLSGSFNAGKLSKTSTWNSYVDVIGTVTADGSGFVRENDFSVQLVNGGTVNSTNAVVAYQGQILSMSGGEGMGVGTMKYDTYRILSGHTADALAIHQHHADSANAKVALVAGGTLNANDANGVEVTADGGTINLTAGALSGTWTNATVNATGGSLAGRFEGTSTLEGSNGFNLGSTAVQNDGSLTLKGSFDASGMASTLTNVNMRVDENGTVSQDGSGFLRTGDFNVQVANGTVDSTNAEVTYAGQTLSMTGGTGFGVGEVKYDTYLLQGDDTATVSRIIDMAGDDLQKIDMQGGTLNVNASTDKLEATGGLIQLSAGTLGGSIGGTAAVAVSGTATICGNNSYTGGTALSNGNLTITHAKALGNAIISTTGSSSLTVGNGVTLALGTVISNSGTLALSGSFDASSLAKSESDDIYVALDGTEDKDGSGFLRSGDFTVLVVDGGTVDASAATITWNGTALEMTGGIGFAAGAMRYDTYRILSGHTADALAIHQHHADSDNAKVALVAGGTLNANDANGVEVTADGGTINLTAGALSGTWTNATVNATGGSLAGRFEGTSTLEGSNGFNLGSTAVQNDGTLTLSGSFDASGMTSTLTNVDMRVDENGIVSQDGSGFLRTGDFEVLVANGTVDSTNAEVTYGGQTLSMTGGTGFGVGEVQYGTYLLKGDDTATVSRIIDMAGDDLQKIDMQGGTLNVNASTDKLEATGGRIQLSAGTLGGSIGGTAAVAVSGTATISGNNSYTGGTTQSNGNLTITHAKALGTGSISAEGTSSLTVGSGVTLALGSVISNSGTLALSGSIDASALAKSESDDIYVALNGVEDKNGSGFLRSGDFSVLVVNGGTVDSTSATITWHGITLEMTGGTGFAAGATHYDTYRILSGHTADALAIHQHHADSANAKVTLAAGGTLNANDANGVEVAANGGTINLTAGELSGIWTNATVNATGGSLAGRFEGTSTLEGSNGFNLGSTAVQNSGSLTLKGSFDVSGMTSSLTNVNMRVDENGTVSRDGSGFLRTGDFEVLVANGTVDSTNAEVTYAGQTLTMTGGTGFGVGEVKYDTYLLQGDDTATVSKIATMAGTALQKIDMQGGTLNVNASTDKLVATGGSIQLSAGTLGGSISGTAAVAVSGTATLSGNNSYTGGTTLSNGNLTITHAKALGTGSISAEGTSSLTVGSGETLALGSVISNSGTLTLRGSIDASALQLNKTEAGRLSLSGERVGLTESGFSQGVAYSVQLVNGGKSVADGLSIRHDDFLSRTQLVLGEDGVARAGAEVDYTHYFLTGGDSAEVSKIAEVSAQNKAELNGVTMDSGLLTVDQSIIVSATGGSIVLTEAATLGGVIENTAVSSAAGDYVAEISARMKGASTLNIGGGTITVSGDNSYTGGTTVNGGALVAGNGQAFGTGDVVVNNATLDLNQYRIANKVFMNGSSTLGYADGASHIVLGSGAAVNFRDGYTLSIGKRLTVAGPASYTGALTLGGGTLELDGLLTVRGDVTFSDGEKTTLDISGWSGLGDGDVLADFGSSNSGYADGCLSLNGITGEWTLAFDAATGVLTLVAVKDEPLPEFNPNLDRNQQAVYDTVKDIMGSGNPGGVLGLLAQEIAGTRDEAALKRALDELSGREYATMMNSQIEGNLGHLRRLRASAGKGTPLGEYVTFGGSNVSNKGVDKSDNKGASVQIAPSPMIDSRRIRAGVAAFHEEGDLDADHNGDGFERSETGAQLTMEYLLSNDFALGLGISQSRAKLTPTYGKRRDEDNTHIDLYGVYQSGRWSSTTAIGVGLHQYELGRSVAGMFTDAEADGFSVNFMQDVAYTVWADEQHGVQVFGAVESSFNKMDSFSESGAGNASLLVDEQDAWATDMTVGLRYNRALPALGKALPGTLTVQTGVVASLGDREHEVSMRFAGAAAHDYKQYAAERSRWGYNVGVSVNLPVSAETALYGSAEAVIRNSSTSVDAQMGLKMAF